MANLSDYAKRVGALRFEREPLNEVDVACFSQLTYLPYGIAFEQAQSLSMAEAAALMEHVEAEHVYNVFFKKRLELMRAMSSSPRYADIRLSGYVKETDPESEKQFCALTLTLPDGTRVIGYEGTDSTLVGWKEDFNMSFESPVPAQKDARAYLERMAEGGQAPLIVTGHSKGGNLAVWASAFARREVQERILGVYSFDGPGLMDRDVESAGYAAVTGRILAYLPQGSLVGMLMRRHEPGIVVKSEGFSVLQHDLFTWVVEDDAPAFVRLPQLSRMAVLRDEVLDEWLGGLSLQQREVFCDAIYSVLSADESREKVSDLVKPAPGPALRSMRAMMDMDPETRRMIRRAVSDLFSGGMESMLGAARGAVLEALPAARAMLEALPAGKGREAAGQEGEGEG